MLAYLCFYFDRKSTYCLFFARLIYKINWRSFAIFCMYRFYQVCSKKEWNLVLAANLWIKLVYIELYLVLRSAMSFFLESFSVFAKLFKLAISSLRAWFSDLAKLSKFAISDLRASFSDLVRLSKLAISVLRELFSVSSLPSNLAMSVIRA